jgi:hypothetical protein
MTAGGERALLERLRAAAVRLPDVDLVVLYDPEPAEPSMPQATSTSPFARTTRSPSATASLMGMPRSTMGGCTTIATAGIAALRAFLSRVAEAAGI